VAISGGYVESYVRLHHWVEIIQIFIVLLGLAFLCRFVCTWSR
jgi:Ni,Fe-hydrogenase I cytochrome b subunit